MSLAEDFNPEEISKELVNVLYHRMVEKNLPEEDLRQSADELFNFAKIACNLILQEPGLENPATKQMMPFDVGMAHQAVELFCEGIYHCGMKCLEMGMPANLKTQFLQYVAQDIYLQTKHIVVSTYGQESTPEFQIPKSQQVMTINQTAENALIYYINEYEKQVGPLQLQPREDLGLPDLPPLPEPMPIQDYPMETETPDAAPEYYAEDEGFQAEIPTAPTVQPLPEAAPSRPLVPKGPHPHDKYAAVALLLNTLRRETQPAILRRFNAQERELIEFYREPDNIEKNLDVSCVTRHLATFKALLKQGVPTLTNKTAQAMEALTQQVPKEVITPIIHRERSLIQQYLSNYYPPPLDEDDEEAEAAAARKKRKGLHFEEILPPKVEEILYQFLTQKLQTETS